MKIAELDGIHALRIFANVSQRDKAISELLHEANRKNWWITKIEITQMENFIEAGDIEIIAWCTG